MASNIHIRWMIRRDMPRVLCVETACFEFPWTEDEFTRHCRQRNVIFMVAERDEQLVGFMGYELHMDRLHILNFAVDPAHQRCGVGTAMIAKLRSKLSNQRRRYMRTHVRESNYQAQMFFKAMGFVAVDIVRGAYLESDDDAYVFEFDFCGDARPWSVRPVNRVFGKGASA